jgi:hypothetical protein
MGPGWNAKGPAFAASDIDPDSAHPELPQQRAPVFCRGAARLALHAGKTIGAILFSETSPLNLKR